MFNRIGFYTYCIFLLFIPVFPFFKSISNNEITILISPYLFCIPLFLIIFKNYFNKFNFNIIIFILSIFLSFVFFSYYFFDNIILISKIFIIIVILLILIKINNKENKRFLNVLDYLFIIFFIGGLYISIQDNPNDSTFFDIINGLFNFRYFIFNSIFYFLARFYLYKERNLNYFINILFITTLLIFLYNFFEYFLIYFAENINELEWFYKSLALNQYFPNSVFNKYPFLYSNFTPLGINHSRHMSGFISLFFYYFLVLLLFYYYLKFNIKKLIILIIIITVILPTIFLWSSKTIFFTYILTIFITSLGIFKITKKNYFSNFIIFNFLFIIIVTLYSHFVGLPNFKKNYFNEINYFFTAKSMTSKDVEEIICLTGGKHCTNDNTSQFKYFKINNIYENLYFKYTKQENFNQLNFNILFSRNDYKNINTKKINLANDLFLKINLDLREKKIVFYVNQDNKNIINCNHNLGNNPRVCKNFFLDFEENYGFTNIGGLLKSFKSDDTLEYSSTFLGIDIGSLIKSPLRMGLETRDDKLKTINIIPKVNTIFLDCSLKRGIFNQEYADNNCKEMDIFNNINSENLSTTYDLTNIDIKEDNFINRIFYVKYKTNPFFRYFKYIINDLRLNFGDSSVKNILLGNEAPVNVWTKNFYNIIENERSINSLDQINESTISNDFLKKNKTDILDVYSLPNDFDYSSLYKDFDMFSDDSYFKPDEYKINLDQIDTDLRQISSQADIPVISFFYVYGLFISVIFFAIILISMYFAVINYFNCNDLKRKFVLLFIFMVLFSSFIGMFHLTIFYKISISYLIYTLIGVVSNIDEKTKYNNV